MKKLNYIIPDTRLSLHLSAVLIICACLTACGSFGPTITAENIEQARIRATSLVDAGEHERAARQYEQLAAASRGQVQTDYLHQAAVAWYQADNLSRALTALERSNKPLLIDTDVPKQLLGAIEAIKKNNGVSAHMRLSFLPTPISETYAAEYWRLFGEAHAINFNAVETIKAFIEREAWLNDSSSIAFNHQLLWRHLKTMIDGGGSLSQNDSLSTITQGWFDLAKLYQAHGETLTNTNDYVRWQRQYLNHPAVTTLLNPVDDWDRNNELPSYDTPTSIALLAPLSGPLAELGQSLSRGFATAHSQHQGLDKPQVRVYDTTVAGAGAAYRQALSEGADAVVGPLTKSDVTEVARLANARTLHLALNTLSEPLRTPKSFYQYALDPEHEAKTLAKHAVALGHMRAIGVAPDTAWGQRMLQAFSDELSQYGAEMVDYRFYNEADADHSAWITDVLTINESRARYNTMRQLIGRPLKFEPRRRQDIDVIFLAASPEQGRLIRPQLRFHYAIGLPIYATSRIYEANAADNVDLADIYFADIPWAINPMPLARAWSLNTPTPDVRFTQASRLFAMGFDSYHLLKLTYASNDALTNAWPGLTGRIRLNHEHVFERDLDWARIKDGEAESVRNPELSLEPTGIRTFPHDNTRYTPPGAAR